MAHYEVVRFNPDTHGQQWRVRLVSNGRKILFSESYARAVGAERAILASLRAHGLPATGFAWNVKGREKVTLGPAGHPLRWPLVSYVDEREARP
jgi:uncharacterized protein YegP (UPF0339 family)